MPDKYSALLALHFSLVIFNLLSIKKSIDNFINKQFQHVNKIAVNIDARIAYFLAVLSFCPFFKKVIDSFSN